MSCTISMFRYSTGVCWENANASSFIWGTKNSKSLLFRVILLNQSGRDRWDEFIVASCWSLFSDVSCYSWGGELLITSLNCFKEKIAEIRNTAFFIFVDHDAPHKMGIVWLQVEVAIYVFGVFGDAFFGAPAQDVVSQLLQLEKKMCQLAEMGGSHHDWFFSWR